MVKPGVYSVDKKNVNMKQGKVSVEYVHVQVKVSEKKPPSSAKGCTVKRLVLLFMVIAVLAGIAVGVTYAITWEEGPQPYMPDGDDCFDPEHPGGHDGHHGDHPGDHDDHHGGGGDDDRPGHPHDVRPGTTERRPPIDYVGTRPPQHPTQPKRSTEQHPTRPSRTRPPHDSTRPPRTRSPYDPTRPPRTRPPYDPTRPPRTRPPPGPTRPPHHPPHHPHDPPHHSPHYPPHDHTRPPHYPGTPTERPPPPREYTRDPIAPNRPLFGRPEDGHDYHGNGYMPADDAIPEHDGRSNDESRDTQGNDREDFDHPKMKHPRPYKGMSAWRADQANSQHGIAEAQIGEMTRIRSSKHMGRSRVEMEEKQRGYDYGHSNRNP